jgi:HKD family nuclease
MPSEQINRLKAYYENGDDNIGYDFIRPCLKECVSYRRGTAFFSSSSLKSYADALNHIVEDKVRIEILCSPVITDENLLRTLNENVTEDERINTIQKYQEHFIRKTITKFKEDPDNRNFWIGYFHAIPYPDFDYRWPDQGIVSMTLREAS